MLIFFVAPRKFISLHILICLQLLIVFFTGLSHATQNTPPDAELEPITLQLKWKHDFQFAGYYAAIAQGYYHAEGLKVSLQEASPEISPIKQIVSGQAQYAIGDIGILAHYANGKAIRALAATYQHNPLIFISKQESGIISPYEMRGKRIMMDTTGGDEAPLTAMLAEAGLSQNHFTAVARTFTTKEFIANQVDVISAYITDMPFELKTKNIAFNIINPHNYGVDFYGDILFTSLEEIQQHPQRVARFKRASLKGWQYALEHPEELVQLIHQQYGSKLSIAHLRYEAEITRKLMLPDIIPIGQLEIPRLRRIADTYTNIKLAKKLNDTDLKNFIYYPPEFNLTSQERLWLKQNPVISLAIDHNFPPYEWLDAENNYQGIAADFIHLIEQRLGIKFTLIKDKQAWHETLNQAKKGDIDLLSCLVKTPEREQYLNFSPAYINSSAVIIAERSQGYISSLKQLSGRKVVIHKGHFTQELLNRHHPDISIITTDTIQQALRLVATGKATAFVGDVTAASYAIKKLGLLNLGFAGQTPYQSEFRFATAKHHPELQSIIRKALASITTSEKEAIFKRWQKLEITQGLSYATVLKYAAIMLGILLCFAYWIYRLKQAEAARKDSETKLHAILDNAPIGIWLSNTNGGYTFVNKTFCNAVGIPENDFITTSNLADLLGADLAEHCHTSDTACINQNEPHISHKLVPFADGQLHNLEVTKTKLFDSAGQLAGIIGISVDATERKQTEESLRLAAAVYKYSDEAMFIVDEHDFILATNPAFTRVTGYREADVLGKCPKLLQSTQHGNLFYKKMWVSLNKKGSWEGEVWNTHKNGSLFAVWLNINTIYNDDGAVSQRVALFYDITEKKKSDELIWQQANFDLLTQLPNRHMFQDRLAQEISKSHRENLPLALLFIDLDHFKEINDTLGHQIGDLLLTEAAQRIVACVRDTDTVARLGGDEFTVILAKLNDTLSIERITLAIIKTLTQPFQLGEHQSYISASIGITLYPNDGKTVTQLLKNADQAMYLAKNLGRNRFSYFTPAMQETAQKHLQILTDLRSAVAEQQLELYYQPIVELSSGKIYKAEALLRWHHPIHGMISPADFIPIAEESGLIIGIGDWVFKEATRQVKYWMTNNAKNIQVSINKSPVQFQVPEKPTEWGNHLKEQGLSGEQIVIEITEGVLMETSQQTIQQLLHYRDMGIQVSIDDFGTGYSSLAYLNKFDIDYLKIDQSFTRNLSADSNDMILSEAIIVMAHKLGLKVIAEGMETERQRQLLLAAGCDYGQGYLFSKPVPAKEFIKLID
ncbi:MAG: EAL domain-containing protein [Methyloprofundus sp.]|nr:EAL domain-containing protein [Methyloprofundus sp.]